MLLASCSYLESKNYKGKLVLVNNDDESSKKSEEVLLNIVTDTPNEVIIGGLGIAKCVTTRVSPTYCPDEMKGDIFRLYNLGEDLSGVMNEVDGVVPLLVLPDGYNDMREIWNLAEKHPKLRFIGGNLLGIPGLKIGRYDKGKEKMSSVFNKIYDIFTEVRLEDIEVKSVLSKAKARSSSSKSSSKKSVPKNRKTETFSKLFGGEEAEF